MKYTIKKYLFIILILTILFLLCYLSKKRNRNSIKEGYSIINFIKDFQTINGYMREVREAKSKSEYALYDDSRYEEEEEEKGKENNV